jgi:hypothetical protein
MDANNKKQFERKTITDTQPSRNNKADISKLGAMKAVQCFKVVFCFYSGRIREINIDRNYGIGI